MTIRKLIETTREDLEKLEEGWDDVESTPEMQVNGLRWLLDHLLEQMEEVASLNEDYEASEG